MATVVEYGEDPWVKALRESIVSAGQSIAENIGRNKMMQHNAAKAAADRAHRTYLEQMGIASREKLAKSESIALERHREFGRDLSRKEQAQKEKEWKHAKKARALNIKSAEQQIEAQQHDLQARENEQHVQDGFDFFMNMYDNPENYRERDGKYVWDPVAQSPIGPGHGYARSFAKKEHNKLVKTNRDLVNLARPERREAFRKLESDWRSMRDFRLGALNWLDKQQGNPAFPHVNATLEASGYRTKSLPEKIAWIHSEGYRILDAMPANIIQTLATTQAKEPPKWKVDDQKAWAVTSGFFSAHTDPSKVDLELSDPDFAKRATTGHLWKEYIGPKGHGKYIEAGEEGRSQVQETLQTVSDMWGTVLGNSKAVVINSMTSEMYFFREASGYFPKNGHVSATTERSQITTRVNGLFQALKATINGFRSSKAYRGELKPGAAGVKPDNEIKLEDILADEQITGFLEDFGEKKGKTKDGNHKKQEVYLLAQVLRGNFPLPDESSFAGNRPSEMLLLSLLQDGSFSGKIPSFWHHVHDRKSSTNAAKSIFGKRTLTFDEKRQLINNQTTLQGIRELRQQFEPITEAGSGVRFASYTGDNQSDSQGNQPGGLIDDSEAYVQSVLGINRNDLDRIWQPMANAYNLTPKQQSDMRLYLTKDWAKESIRNSNAYPPIPAGYKMQDLEDDLLNDSPLGKAIKRSIQANLPVNPKTGFKDVGLPGDPGLNSQEKIYHGFKSLARLITIKGLMRDEAGKPQGQIPLFIKQLRRDDEGNPRGLTREDFKSIMADWPVETRVKLQKYLDFIKSFSAVDKTGERDFINILNHLAGKEGIPLEDDV